MSLADVLVETFDDYTGQIDFTKVQGNPSDWYPDSKQTIKVWEEDLTDPEIDYASSYDSDTRLSSQWCKVWRFNENFDSGIDIKYGTPYVAQVGYKIYDSKDAKSPEEEGIGRPIEIIWMHAASLSTAGSILLILNSVIF